MSFVPLSNPYPLMQKVAGNYGVKPNNKQLFGNPEQFPKSKQLAKPYITTGEMRDLSICFIALTLINYDYSENGKKTLNRLSWLNDDINELFRNERYKSVRNRVMAKGQKAVHDAFIFVDGRTLDLHFLIPCLLVCNFEPNERIKDKRFAKFGGRQPLSDVLKEFWAKQSKTMDNLVKETYDKYEKKGSDKIMADTQDYVFKILERV